MAYWCKSQYILTVYFINWNFDMPNKIITQLQRYTLALEKVNLEGIYGG